MKLSIAIFIVFFVPTCLFSQSINEVCKYILVSPEPLPLDSLSILPESIRFDSGLNVDYQYDLSTGKIAFRNNVNLDSILICYSPLPFSFAKTYYNRSFEVYDSTEVFKSKIEPNMGLLQRDELFDTENIAKSGMITRGISFGNRQNVFVNSSLNLNLDGELTDGLNIRAAITDQNIPFQPEGNTQQLQDFDNVFIELYNDRFSLKGGDIVLNNQQSNFLRYYKNVQGAKVSYQYNLSDQISAETNLNIAQAKGRFASVPIEVQDGISGPYKVPGPNGGRFVIIMSNSERLFLDGQLLERGYNHDYTIDYNLGEVTFTSNVLITQYSVVRMDYEFADQDYARTISSINHTQKMGKWSLQFSHYSEKDNRNNSLINVLTNDDKISLSEAGDNLTQAFRPSFDSVVFTSNEILYKKRMGIDNQGLPIEIFEYSSNPDSAHYRVRFNDVGLGNGNYILSEIAANGRIYSWIAPIAGVKQGQFEPVEILPTPDKKQMTTAHLAVALSQYDSVYTEFAFSDHDLNLFSGIDDNDNQGTAIKTGYVMSNRPLSFSNSYLLNVELSFEHDDKNFKAIDRFRKIGFERNWSYTPEQNIELVNDNISTGEIALIKDEKNKISYRISNRNRESTFEGTQHHATWNQSIGQIQMKSNFFNLNSSFLNTKSKWQKLQTDVSWHNRLFTPGYIYRFDKNSVYHSVSDSLLGGVMNYDEHSFYITNRADSEHTYRLEYSLREDGVPNNGELVNNTLAQTLSLNSELNIGTNHLLKSQLIYRKVEYQLEQENDENLMGRVEWQGQLLDNHVRTTVKYSLGSGRELKREFVYVEVPLGQGTHAWRDLNNDDIQDLNEFFIAINPDEKQFVKIFVPTTDFVNAYTNGLNMNVSTDMPRQWRAEEGVKRFLSGFSNMTSWIADSKVTDGDFKSRFLSFAANDQQLLSNRSSLRSVLFFNRSSTRFGAEGGVLKTTNQQLLTSGQDKSELSEYHSIARWHIQRIYTLKLGAKWGDKLVTSDYLADRNYRVNQTAIGPTLSWQPGSSFRVTGKYTHANYAGTLFDQESEEYSTLHNSIELGLRYTKLSKGTFSADVRYIDIEFDGVENSALGYELLNALRPGTNVTWNANFILKFTSGIQLQMNYEGRKSPGIDVVNIGRVQVSAMF